jgi:hypothetical protein
MHPTIGSVTALRLPFSICLSAADAHRRSTALSAPACPFIGKPRFAFRKGRPPRRPESPWTERYRWRSSASAHESVMQTGVFAATREREMGRKRSVLVCRGPYSLLKGAAQAVHNKGYIKPLRLSQQEIKQFYILSETGRGRYLSAANLNEYGTFSLVKGDLRGGLRPFCADHRSA